MLLVTAIIATLFTNPAICVDLKPLPSPDLPDLPSPNQFLAELLNTTIDNIGAVANGFKFVDVDPKQIQFVYFPKGKQYELITDKNKKLIDPSKKSKIIIHGWSSTATADWVQKIADNYHASKSHLNILAVNWTYYASKNYFVSATAVQSVGDIVGQFVCKNFGKNLKNLHLIGHSLGAHVSGFAGKTTRAECKRVAGMITGLDPAGPLFSIPVPRPASLRLDKTDAGYVQVIHTDAGFLGTTLDYGSSDFYPNGGGPIQPECTGNFTSTIKLYPPIVCSHSQSQVFFTDTILKPKIYPAKKCQTRVQFSGGLCKRNPTAYMGDGVSVRSKGNYYLSTAPSKR